MLVSLTVVLDIVKLARKPCCLVNIFIFYDNTLISTNYITVNNNNNTNTNDDNNINNNNNKNNSDKVALEMITTIITLSSTSLLTPLSLIDQKFEFLYKYTFREFLLAPGIPSVAARSGSVIMPLVLEASQSIRTHSM